MYVYKHACIQIYLGNCTQSWSCISMATHTNTWPPLASEYPPTLMHAHPLHQHGSPALTQSTIPHEVHQAISERSCSATATLISVPRTADPHAPCSKFSNKQGVVPPRLRIQYVSPVLSWLISFLVLARTTNLQAERVCWKRAPLTCADSRRSLETGAHARTFASSKLARAPSLPSLPQYGFSFRALSP